MLHSDAGLCRASNFISGHFSWKPHDSVTFRCKNMAAETLWHFSGTPCVNNNNAYQATILTCWRNIRFCKHSVSISTSVALRVCLKYATYTQTHHASYRFRYYITCIALGIQSYQFLQGHSYCKAAHVKSGHDPDNGELRHIWKLDHD